MWGKCKTSCRRKEFQFGIGVLEANPMHGELAKRAWWIKTIVGVDSSKIIVRWYSIPAARTWHWEVITQNPIVWEASHHRLTLVAAFTEKWRFQSSWCSCLNPTQLDDQIRIIGVEIDLSSDREWKPTLRIGPSLSWLQGYGLEKWDDLSSRG